MSERLNSALTFMVLAHAGQDRDGEVPPPYACHPVEVMLNLRYGGGVTDEDLLIVGLLHDTLEETKVTEAQIHSAFGDRVAKLVRELTRREPGDSELAGLSREEIWNLRSGILLAEIAEMSVEGQTVKLADRLSNLHEARFAKSPAKFARYLGQTEKILELIPRKRNVGLWDAVRAEARRK